MITLLTILHVFVCVFLILVVLLQPGKAGGMGAAFGGASQAVFGARGATSFLGKVTAACAVIFMLTSIGLSYLATSKEKTLRAASQRQEQRAKAREVRPTKANKATKAGAMSTPDEGAGAGGGEGATKAPSDDGADEGDHEAAPSGDAEGTADEPTHPAPAKQAPTPAPAPSDEE